MKQGIRALGGIVLLMCVAESALTTVLNVPTVIQEQSQWCWAAVSTSVIRAGGTNIQQCAVAEYTRGRATWHSFGAVNCCADPSQGCDYWNYNYGYNGSIEDILSHWGINSYGWWPLSLSEVGTEIAANRPFIVRWGWDAGGGHFVVGYGVEGSNVYYMNPWPGEGAKIADYSWVVQGGGHTWTHTNVLTTALPVQMVAFRATWSQTDNVHLEWSTVSEMNNYGFEVQRKKDIKSDFEPLPEGFVRGHGTTVETNRYAFVDRYPVAGEAWYRLKQIDLDGSEHYSEEILAQRLTAVVDDVMPRLFEFPQNYPNPFNPSTTIRYEISDRSHVRVSVYNALGQEIAVVTEGEQVAGYHDVLFDGKDLPTGVYFCRLQAGSFVATRKLVLAR